MQFLRHALDGVVVDALILAQSIGMKSHSLPEKFAGEPCVKMAAVVEANAKHDIARLDGCEIRRQLALAPECCTLANLAPNNSSRDRVRDPRRCRLLAQPP